MPTPIPVRKDEWSKYDWDEASVAEVHGDDKDTKIFVNMDNRHLLRLLRTGGYQETGITRMQNSFLLYVAFYAWAKHMTDTGTDLPLEGKAYDEYVHRELDRLAQTVTYSISSLSTFDNNGQE